MKLQINGSTLVSNEFIKVVCLYGIFKKIPIHLPPPNTCPRAERKMHYISWSYNVMAQFTYQRSMYRYERHCHQNV